MARHCLTFTGGLAVALFVAVGYLGAVGRQQPATSLPPSSLLPQRAVLDRYCVGCHNDKLKTAGLALDTMDTEHVSEAVDAWEKVVRKLRARAMPPADRPRPDEDTYNALVSSLEASLDAVAAARPNPGRTDTFHRLNRNEYHNAIRDLLALEVDTAALLPADDSSHGFDNITVGDLSTTLLDRYLTVALKIARLSVGSAVRAPDATTTVLPPDLTQEDHFDGLPFGTRGGTSVRHTFPRDAEYEIQIRLARDGNDESIEGLAEAHEIEITLDGEQVRLFSLAPARGQGYDRQDPRSEDGDTAGVFTVRVPVKAGPHVLGATFLKKPTLLLETVRQPSLSHFNVQRHPRTQPAVYRLSITGPFDSSGAGDTPSRRRIFGCRPARPSEEAACARTILSTLARRAYRRPVTDEDLQALLTFYEEARAAGGFDAGIERALAALLVSPEFLFRIERDPTNVPPNSAYRISDLELASRLSFFLWSSIPDDELIDVAVRGRLRQPAVLEQQVRRLLADVRSRALVSNFAGQWLHWRNLGAVTPDPVLFIDFDDNLRQALQRETELFFESIVKEDRSALDLLGANYTFLNERLAKHYGIPNVYGSRFRRVALGEDRVRGGLLGQGSILTVTSYADRTSPVLRGKWILENILGTPPPPAPPNIPPLPDNHAAGRVLSMRERMVQHRTNPVCAGCHQLMDPIGLSLENFDAIGRWRTRGESGAHIDASGALPDGTTLEGVSGLKRALMSRPDGFVTTMTEKLLMYALGRGIEHYDAAAVRRIVRDAYTSNYRFSSIVLSIVRSTPFQMRSSQ